MGNRALFSIGCILLGVVIELILTGVGIGGIIAVISVYNLLSLCEKEKTIYLNTVRVTLPNGKITPCAMFEQKVYAYAPLILAFFSIGYYVPYKTQYILVPNKEIKNIAPKTRVSPSFLTNGLLNFEIIPQSKYHAIISNPQIIANELNARIAPRREAFLNEAKLFFETGLLEEIYYTDDLSICKVCDDETFVLFHYESHSGVQCGMFFNKDYIEKIKEDPGFLLESYIGMDAPKMLFLTNEVLERLLRIQKENPDKKDALTNTESLEVLSRVNQNKKVLTKDIIEQTLNRSSSKPKKAFGIIFCLPALGAIELAIAGFATGLFVMGIICLPLGIWLWYIAIKKIRQGKKNKENAMRGQYKIVQAACISSTKEVREDEDGTTVFYTTKFSDGESQTLNYSSGVEGDTFYLVYLPESKKVNAIFNSIEYVPSADLLIEK